ncbi:MAG: hypothetical protein WDN24_13665 [Sphingomonas sp.]
MAGEDFGRFWIADTRIQSSIFWVGGVPRINGAVAGGQARPPLAPQRTLGAPGRRCDRTATEAITAAALDVLKK